MNKNRDTLGRYEHTGETESKYFYGNFGHRKIYERAHGKIPGGYVIHHINGDKLDNRLENLQLMTSVEHNRLHRHAAWNKGKTWSKKTITKIQEKRNETFMKRWGEWKRLRDMGYSYIKIAELSGYCRESISLGVRRYERRAKTK